MVCGCLIPCGERQLSGYNYRIATDKAITDSRHNDTPVQSQVERERLLGVKTPQLMRAAPGDPRRGVIPVELIRNQPHGNFPMPAAEHFSISGGERRGVEDK